MGKFIFREDKMKQGFILILLGLSMNSYTQSLNVGFLFNPGITLGTDVFANSYLNDSTSFQLNKYKGQLVLPLKTKLGVDGLTLKNFSLKKIDAKASQIFLTFNGGITQPLLNEDSFFENVYDGAVGLTGLYASVKKGIWMYAANIYFSETKTTLKNSPNPNFRGYLAKTKIHDLRFVYFYGASLIVNQGKIIPVPMFGFRKRILPKVTGSLVFPMQVKLKYKQSGQLNFDLAANYDGISAIDREGSALKGNDHTLNYSQLKTYLGVNGKLGGHYQFAIELGFSSLRRMTEWSSDFSQHIASVPYVSLALNYRFGQSVFDNFMNQME